MQNDLGKLLKPPELLDSLDVSELSFNLSLESYVPWGRS